MSKFKIYAKSILIPVILGSIVGFIISGFIDYNSLIKPPFAPPSILFPIIWTIFYVLMGLSYGILDSNNLVDYDINSIYYLQLIFNLLWPIIFFVFEARLFAFIWIIILAILVIIMTVKFFRKNQISGILQIPYIVWTFFATYLNLSIYLLNR